MCSASQVKKRAVSSLDGHSPTVLLSLNTLYSTAKLQEGLTDGYYEEEGPATVDGCDGATE